MSSAVDGEGQLWRVWGLENQEQRIYTGPGMVVKIDGEYYRLIESGPAEWRVDQHPDLQVREVEGHLLEVFRGHESLGRFYGDDLLPVTVQQHF